MKKYQKFDGSMKVIAVIFLCLSCSSKLQYEAVKSYDSFISNEYINYIKDDINLNNNQKMDRIDAVLQFRSFLKKWGDQYEK